MFGEIINGVMKLNDYGKIVKEEWFKTKLLRDNVELVDEEFVVMPNHIHGIIWINEGDMGWGTALNDSDGLGKALNDSDGWGTARCAPTSDSAPTDSPPTDNAPTDGQFGEMIPRSIPTIVRAYKSAVTKQINLLRQTPGEAVWQRNYYEHIIRSEKDYEAIANYIYDNPLYWEKDDENQSS